MFLDVFGRVDSEGKDLVPTLKRFADDLFQLKLGCDAAAPAVSVTGLSRAQLARLRDEIDRALAEGAAPQPNPAPAGV